MSTAAPIEAVPPSPTAAKSKKSKKKKSVAKKTANGEETKVNGIDEQDDGPGDEEAEVNDAGESAAAEDQSTDLNGSSTDIVKNEKSAQSSASADVDNHKLEASSNSPDISPSGGKLTEDTKSRLDAMASEREALKNEVVTLRKSLEIFQGNGEDMSDLRKELEETKKEKEQAESNYQNLRGRVNQIKQQLGERLKSDAEELTQCRTRIEELEQQNSTLNEENKAREEELKKLAEESEERSKELSSLRNRLNLSQQNWNKEREELLEREVYAKEEFEQAKQAMQDWEILAMDERSIRENLSERVAELEEQVTNHREAHENLESERQNQSLTVDGLQRALKELQDARKKELREMVENSQSQIGELRKQLEEAEEKAVQATKLHTVSEKELERVQPFEVEVKEKNLLIGKLRHEAVILNDHLTKALRQLKKGKPEDTIDRQLVTNHFLHFLSIDRSDPRKFQVLQIIASLLNWSDEQREQAGLARPGASNVNLRAPITPWNRTPSTPSLSTDAFGETPSRSETIGGLFSEFLERESEDGRKDSRATSVSGSTKP